MNRPAFAQKHPLSNLLPLATIALLAACGPAQQGGGFHGFPPAQVSLVTVEAKTIPVVYEYVGQTNGSKEVEIRARVTGILERKLFEEGSAVKAGQVLFTIDPKPLAAQAAAAEAEVVRAQAQKAQAERELARLKPLAEKKAVGQKEADDAASSVDLANASVRAAEAKLTEIKLSLGYTRVSTPITGLSSRAPKSEGSLVTANETLLTTIWQTNPIWVPFTISENEQLSLNRAVAEGRLVLPKDNAFNVTVQLADGTTFPRQGKINFTDTKVNPSTGTYEMRAELPNADSALKPGQFVRVKLAGAMRKNALAVPQIAVLDGPQGKFVYVPDKDKDGKDIAAVRPVTLGQWVEVGGINQWIVESGLKPGDRVIVDGVAKLHAGAQLALGAPPAPGGAPAGAPPAAAAPAKDGAPATPAAAPASKS